MLASVFKSWKAKKTAMVESHACNMSVGLLATFHSMCGDSSAMMDAAQFSNLLQCLDPGLSDQQCAQLMRLMDEEGTNAISLADFVSKFAYVFNFRYAVHSASFAVQLEAVFRRIGLGKRRSALRVAVENRILPVVGPWVRDLEDARGKLAPQLQSVLESATYR